MKRLLYLLLAVALGAVLLAACDETTPGQRCDTSADCDPPLLCSNETAPEGTLGICVPASAVPDAAVTEDASP